jgi:hypothetical protein
MALAGWLRAAHLKPTLFALGASSQLVARQLLLQQSPDGPLGARDGADAPAAVEASVLLVERDRKDVAACRANAALVNRARGADVVRVRYLLPHAADFPAAWPALREAFGNVRPAATMQECGLADPRMRIEIEVDAIVGSAG